MMMFSFIEASSAIKKDCFNTMPILGDKFLGRN